MFFREVELEYDDEIFIGLLFFVFVIEVELFNEVERFEEVLNISFCIFFCMK